jgi:hypothetical protein
MVKVKLTVGSLEIADPLGTDPRYGHLTHNATSMTAR